jgi:hypothetical protein
LLHGKRRHRVGFAAALPAEPMWTTFFGHLTFLSL